MVRPSKPPVLDPELIALATTRGTGRQRKKPRKKMEAALEQANKWWSL